jgi:anti-anti-sigma factor
MFNAERARRVLVAIEGPAIVDLATVTHLSSAGLSELARVAKRVGAGTVTLANMQPQVLRVLQIVQFEKLFLFAPANNRRADRPLEREESPVPQRENEGT